MWQVSVLLKNADKIPPSVKAELVPAAAAAAVPVMLSAPSGAAPATAESPHDHH
jgi:hypothetical protein